MLDPWSNHWTVHLQWTVDGWCDPGYTANHTVALLASSYKTVEQLCCKNADKPTFPWKFMICQTFEGNRPVWDHPSKTMTVRLSSSQALLPVNLCSVLKNTCGGGNNSAFVTRNSATNIFGLKLNKTKSFRHLMWETLVDWTEFFFPFSGNFHRQTSPRSLMLSNGVLQFLVILLQLPGLWHPFSNS